MVRGSIISRFAGTGMIAALGALLLWPIAVRYDAALWPFLGLLAVTALAGSGILLLTGADLLLHPRRSERVGPIRVFDLISGAALLAFALLQLHWLGGGLPG